MEINKINIFPPQWGRIKVGADTLKDNLEKAKELRKNMTPQERKLWNILRNHQFYGYEIRRQYPIDKYIVDFICRQKKIIIEIDGGQHNQIEAIEYDKKRSSDLSKLGYKVIRFWNNDIDKNLNGVYKILQKEFNIQED